MARNFRLWQEAQCVQLLAPQASSATLTLTSPFINIRFGHKIYLECDVNQGNAALVTFTPLQATSLGGAGSKALTNPTPIAVILNTTGNDQFTFPTPSTFYQTDAALGPKSVIFEIDPGECMDINNLASFLPGGAAFHYVGVQVSASSTANLVACRAKIILARDQRQNPSTVFV